VRFRASLTSCPFCSTSTYYTSSSPFLFLPPYTYTNTPSAPPQTPLSFPSPSPPPFASAAFPSPPDQTHRTAHGLLPSTVTRLALTRWYLCQRYGDLGVRMTANFCALADLALGTGQPECRLSSGKGGGRRPRTPWRQVSPPSDITFLGQLSLGVLKCSKSFFYLTTRNSPAEACRLCTNDIGSYATYAASASLYGHHSRSSLLRELLIHPSSSADPRVGQNMNI
jgi:hypothetical protein